MADLELVGLHADGEHLVLIGPDGHRHRIAIDDALRAAVRHDRPRLEQVRTASLVRPREIQSRIRAGESPVDIAHDAGVPVEQVRRYQGPVTAERNWVTQQARLIPLGRESDAPRLGDLVVDRLARRGVDLADLTWTAVRRPGEGWELVLEFRAGERDRQARWGVDIPTRALHALDDESRWLSETDLSSADARRHLSSVQSRVYDVEVDTASPAPAPDPSPHWASGRARRHERPPESHAPQHRDRPADYPEAVTSDIGPDVEPSDGASADLEIPEAAAGADQIAERIRRAKTDDARAAGTPGRGTTDDAAPSESASAREAADDAPATEAEPDSSDDPRHEADRRTAELLEGLRASRGVRQEIGRLDEEDEDEAQWAGAPATQAPAPPTEERPPATVRQLRSVPASVPEPEPTSKSASKSESESESASESASEAGGRAGDGANPQPAHSSPETSEPAQSTREASEPAQSNPQPPIEAKSAATRTPSPAAGGRSPAAASRRPGANERAEPRPQPSPARPRTDIADPGAADDQETAILSPVLPAGDPARKSKSKSRRTSVPSWDEIVFGSKPE